MPKPIVRHFFVSLQMSNQETRHQPPSKMFLLPSLYNKTRVFRYLHLLVHELS